MKTCFCHIYVTILSALNFRDQLGYDLPPIESELLVTFTLLL